VQLPAGFAAQVDGIRSSMVQLGALGQLTNLTSLSFSSSAAVLHDHTGTALLQLSRLQQLRNLELRSCWLVGSEEAAGVLGLLTSLTRLDVSNNPLNLQVIAALGSCSSLVGGDASA
jgi:Leucine-rich repeat (LRR) protein